MLKLGPALASGSTVVLKPAPETPLDAYLLAESSQEAGLPAGVLNIVQAGREVGEHLVTHPDVDKISVHRLHRRPASKIGALCGEQLKRCTLELGGKSAAIILDDADLATDDPGLLPNAIMNNGQACVAQTRILASRARYDEVVDALATAAMSAMPRSATPLDPETVVGPARSRRASATGSRATSPRAGKRAPGVVTGGGRPAGFDKGWYVEPTVFADVDNKMTIAQEEIFGPVLVGHPLRRRRRRGAHRQRLRLRARRARCGPSRRRSPGLDVAQRVRTGTYGVNGIGDGLRRRRSAASRSPGSGRELGPEGLEEYLELKAINMPAGWTPAT